jgi:hypothetical protein
MIYTEICRKYIMIVIKVQFLIFITKFNLPYYQMQPIKLLQNATFHLKNGGIVLYFRKGQLRILNQ